MKLIIVTVYNSHNSGSFFQAYALMKILMSMGHEVAFLKRDVKGSSHDMRKVVKGVLKECIKMRVFQAMNTFRQWFEYNKLQQSFPIVDKSSKFYKTADCIILGSDTIWNFDSKYFLRKASKYLGYEFAGKHIITYAASAANTRMDKFKEVISENGCLSNIDTILVRDKYTQQLVEETTSFKTKLVTDPTLIVPREIFDIYKYTINNNRNYLLLYYFGKVPSELQKAIKDYASEHSLEIISMPEWHRWSNRSEMSSPRNMVSWFSMAKVIVTNTFHGVAFSIIYEKPYAVYDDGKNKVLELLETYNETHRLFTDINRMTELLSNKSNAISSGRVNSIAKDSIEKLKLAL